MSLDERSESLNIRTANGVEKQVRIFQEPGMFFFPTMVLSGIKPGQEEKEFAPLDHYPVISPQSDKNWLVDSIIEIYEWWRDNSFSIKDDYEEKFL